MQTFSVEITVLGDEDDETAFDSASMVELPEGQSISEEQLATLTKRIAVVVSDYLRGIYKDADITVCT